MFFSMTLHMSISSRGYINKAAEKRFQTKICEDVNNIVMMINTTTCKSIKTYESHIRDPFVFTNKGVLLVIQPLASF